MFSLRDWIIFFAGVEAFHTVVHIILYFAGDLPLHLAHLTITNQFNMFGIVLNASITGLLLWWAHSLKLKAKL